MISKSRFSFPQIEKVNINGFSLYSKNGEVINVSEEINQGVYCLAGANGLGKTTFLNAINYALTGIVLEPERNVLSPDDIVEINRKYTESYFNGRIKARDKEKAEIEILLRINDKYVRIIRSFFRRNELIDLEYYGLDGDRKVSILDSSKKLSPKDLQKAFEQIITEEIGIGKYSHYLFFQLYVFTFDENRRMLFWDDDASNSALSVAFNANLEDTDKLLSLSREMDKLESAARNARYQASLIKNKIDELTKDATKKSEKDEQELRKEYFGLVETEKKNEEIFENLNTEYDNLLKRQNLINSEIFQHKLNYKRLFSKYSEPRSNLLENPIVKVAKKNHECYLCGSKGHHVIENLEKKLYADNCPACDTPINNGNNEIQDDLLNQIKSVDEELAKKNAHLEDLLLESETKKVELVKAEHNLKISRNKRAEFESINSKISFEKTGDAPLDTVLDEYRKQFDHLDRESKQFYKDRDNLKPKYENLLHKVDEGYKEAEELFVPLFKKLAKSFIGIDLNIYIRKKGRNLALYFEMQDSARTSSHQLSESQRFFLDIALRMALGVHLSKDNNPSTMLIDTPEGSLDIAYENRVGKMFGEFIVKYHQNILMTANINASRLLVSLAEECGAKKMYFRRMLQWTDLNEIQKEGEHLFNEVYSSIDKALNRNE